MIDEEVFARVHRILSRFFAVIIIDSGNNELASNWLAALDVADGLVVPTQWRQDHVVTANKMLKTLRDRQHPVLERTMIVGTNAPAAAQAAPKKAAYEWFYGQHRHQVVEIPTDAAHPRGRGARLLQAVQEDPAGRAGSGRRRQLPDRRRRREPPPELADRSTAPCHPPIGVRPQSAANLCSL